MMQLCAGTIRVYRTARELESRHKPAQVRFVVCPQGPKVAVHPYMKRVEKDRENAECNTTLQVATLWWFLWATAKTCGLCFWKPAKLTLACWKLLTLWILT